MQDIAEACGISKMTVSLALRGDPRVKTTTRDKVLAEARKLGYQTNPYIATLMAQLRSGDQRKYQPVIAFLNLQDPPTRLHTTNAGKNYFIGARDRLTSETGHPISLRVRKVGVVHRPFEVKLDASAGHSAKRMRFHTWSASVQRLAWG